MRAIVGCISMALALSPLASCTTAAEREWRVAGDPRASAGDIINAGHPVDVARSGGQTVVTWEVEPEDDEGPYQGAWRLYGKDGKRVADGRFKQVFESSARIAVHPLAGGFLIGSYAGEQPYRLDHGGRLHRVGKDVNTATLLGSYTEKGDYRTRDDWWLRLPHQTRVVRWNDLPTDEPQGKVFAGGELWVLLPRTRDYEPGQIAHSPTGRRPWATETIPNPSGSYVDGESMTASERHVFATAVAFGGPNDDRTVVKAVLSRALSKSGAWHVIDPKGIDDRGPRRLTSAPRVTELPDGRLFATSPSEGAWLEQRGGGWRTVKPPQTSGMDAHVPPAVIADRSRLWSLGAHSLYYSDDLGRSWREFDR